MKTTYAHQELEEVQEKTKMLTNISDFIFP